ncbi:MAG: diaminopimelate epimerase [Candidatus Omnitrophica bacterium]|nr:diaminopimelate epimerase [Candidatus Omnitrophota bacterium]
MKKIAFVKMCGAGNDFVVIDNRNVKVPRLKRFAQEVCDRKRGVGADGLLLLEKSNRADFKMRIFNPDGSEPDMCGNGARCIAFYANRNRAASDKMTFETRAGLISAGVKGKNVKLKLNGPLKPALDIKLNIDGKTLIVSRINTGVPHAVVFVNNLTSVNVKGLGKKIRYHKRFSPAGTNVNFVKVSGKHSISIRTYERGVEDETLACGTGSTASALISSLVKGVISPVNVNTYGGDILKIYFEKSGEGFKNVFLEGKVKEVFEGGLTG